MTTLSFEKACRQIRDGDLITVRGRHGVLAAFTRFFTYSRHTHNGVAIWIQGRLWVAELNGGRNHYVPIEQLADIEFDVSDSLVADRIAVRQSIIENMKVRINYGFGALFVIGLLNFFKIRADIPWRRILVCSGFCMKIYQSAGYPDHTLILSPRDIFDLAKYKFTYTPSGD